MSSGTVLDIQHHSIHDGPGIRTTVFLKGCPLRCIWCCNPESQDFRPEYMFAGSRCIKCGACEAVCPAGACKKGVIDPELCQRCEKCVLECYSGALRTAGAKMTADEVMEEILKDTAYYDSNGGVTFSGGEAFSQPEFLEEILVKCGFERLHTLVETCGYFNWEACGQSISKTDMIYFDIKHCDNNSYIKYTGVKMQPILNNLKKLVRANKNVTVRIPVIKGYNADINVMETIGQVLHDCGYKGAVHLLPYHAYGSIKYEQLGRTYGCSNAARPADEDLNRYLDCLNKQGYQAVCYG